MSKKERRITLVHWLILLALFAASLVAISFYGGTVSYSFFFAVLARLFSAAAAGFTVMVTLAVCFL